MSGVQFPPLLFLLPTKNPMSPASIIEKICGFWRSYLSPGKAVLAAVSGGSDSVALIFLLNELQEKLKLGKLAVAHINHGLRGEE